MVDILSSLQTAFEGTMFRASDAFWHTDFLRTGIAGVDYALGGGFGYGRLAELYGRWSSGKTMLLYKALANNQKMGGVSALWEAEGAFSPDFYASLGGNPETLLVYPVDTVEDAFSGFVKVCDLMAEAAKKGDKTPVAMGWDGIAATGTKHLLDVGMEKRDMSKANAMSTGCQLITTLIKSTRVALIATNQTREKIGDMDSSIHTPGGNAWPFHSSQRVLLEFAGGTKGSLLLDGNNEPIGRWVTGQVTKNKLGPPFKKFMLPIYVVNDEPHPVYPDKKTHVGIDEDEALFYFYAKKTFMLPNKEAVMEHGAWNSLHPSIAPGFKKFMQRDWPEVLEKFPILRTLPYDPRKSTTPDSPGTASSGAAGSS